MAVAWTGGSDKSSGDLVTDTNWNNYLGVDGSLDYLNERFVMLASPSQEVADTNRTSSLSYTNLDLTSATAADAHWVYLQIYMFCDSISSAASAVCRVRKDGDTPTYTPYAKMEEDAGMTANGEVNKEVWCEMTTGQVIEYSIDISGTIQVDTYIRVLGYIRMGA